ncbi:fatty acyl-CoA hydrolase precursor, medium chain [Diabrotica undecimpunctata]|uniref:fatty acyl-CoA hydrolase precursor, medium chain n=1 Tax=Diabrotica undecimpunctata TaxID=50387 RepID=UPI003B63786C
MFGSFERIFLHRSSTYLLIYIAGICLSLAKDFKTIIDIPNQGKLRGVELSKLRIQKIIAYYGIPYAQAPVNNLRFAPPVTDPLPAWDGVKNDTEYAPSCLQTEEDYKESEKPFLQLISKLNFTLAEDCLYLNVFIPYGDEPKQGFATVIWFHPGNFTTGTPAMWNPHTLVYRQRVIIVTVSYRLNIMGFFTTMDGEASGNYGLLDQQAAMMWVKKNIKLFGGNSDNICIMGYGTGAMSVGLHLINPQSRGLFNKAIAMSGNILNPSEVKHAQEDKDLLDVLSSSFGCDRKPTSALIQCLRHAEAESLVQQTVNINWRPILDAEITNSSVPFLSDLPIRYFERGDYEKVPLLTGYTHMEHILEIDSLKNITSTSNEYLQALLTDLISGDIPIVNNSESSCVYNSDHLIDAVMFFYSPSIPVKDAESFREILINFFTERNVASSVVQLASLISKEQPTYVYRFDMKPSTPAAVINLPEWATVPHLFDLLYVWGVPYWTTNQDWDIRDKRISDTIMSFWMNFAKSSNPTENSIYPVTWEKYTEESPGILIIDGNFNMSNSKNLNYKAFDFWNKYYPKVKAIATQCCESFDTGSSLQTHFLVQTIPLFLLCYRFIKTII